MAANRAAGEGTEVFVPSAPEWAVKGRIPCLDGLRAFAIALVLISHFTQVTVFDKLHNGILSNVGHRGVTLFFVISGFLITLLMLRESDRTGTISLVDFYRRRTLRIMPALSFYLLSIYLLQVFGFFRIATDKWLTALTYTMCYNTKPSTPLEHYAEIGHTWSLSVEEHFYLLWPLIFCALKPAKAFKVLVGYLIAVPLLRFIAARYFNNLFDIEYASVTQMGSIGMGCVIAYAAQGRAFSKLNVQILRRPLSFLMGGFALVAFVYLVGFAPTNLPGASFLHKLTVWFGNPVEAVGFSIVVLAALYAHQSALFRVLNWRPLVFVGVLSYSIYLWQQLFTGPSVFTPARTGLHWTLSLVFIAFCALFSYYVVETPFLRIKDRKSNRLRANVNEAALTQIGDAEVTPRAAR